MHPKQCILHCGQNALDLALREHLAQIFALLCYVLSALVEFIVIHALAATLLVAQQHLPDPKLSETLKLFFSQ